jgi:hypothetical protein
VRGPVAKLRWAERWHAHVDEIGPLVRGELLERAGGRRPPRPVGLVELRQRPLMPVGERDRLRSLLDPLIAPQAGPDDPPHQAHNEGEQESEEDGDSLHHRRDGRGGVVGAIHRRVRAASLRCYWWCHFWCHLSIEKDRN